MSKILLRLSLLVAVLGACERAPLDPELKAAFEPVFTIVGPISQLSVGTTHTCGILSDGSASCWGFLQGAKVPAGLGSVTHVSTGWGHTCAVRSSDANVICWGQVNADQTIVPSGLGAVSGIDAGDSHNCAVKATDVSVVCWGNNYHGQATVPAGLGPVTQVSAGSAHACAVRTDGTVSCWGSGFSGAQNPPAGLTGVVHVSAGRSNTCALKNDNSAVCWGINGPVVRTDVEQVSAGGSHACALKIDGTVICWGANQFGQASPPPGAFIQVAVGTNASCALTAGGTVSCWGMQSDLVTGSFTDVSAGYSHSCGIKTDTSLLCWGVNPNQTVPAGLGGVKQVSTGTEHTCAIRQDDTLACWGHNWSGQVDVPYDLGTVTQVSAGHQHTCAVKTDGELVCWGRNPDEHWNGYPDPQATPPADLGLVRQVSVGLFHTCALTTAGTARCWGQDDYYGQLSGPASAVGVTQVVSGDSHTCVLKSDGSVGCWGLAWQGAINMPSALGNVIQLAGGSYHACALKNDGTIICWGDNSAGQASPPAWLGSARRIATGHGQTCAVINDGTVECWGVQVSTTHLLPGATAPGTNVTVQPLDETTGEPAPVSLNFSNVTGGGTTTVTSGSIGGGSGPPPPTGFRLSNPNFYFDITTTATFSGPVTVCINYTGTTFGNENHLELLHGDGSGQWEPVTTSHDTENNIICGTVTSLSPFLVAEENMAPIVTGLALPNAPVAVGTSVSANAAFTDANPGDTHTATIDWNTGATSNGSVSESNGAGSASGSNTYSAPGVYTVSASVSDGDLTGTRSSSSDQPAYIVVYDPSSGFVTGGGWFDSPTSACSWTGCATDGSTTGKASFGFVSRYQRGAVTPTGNTEFQFKTGGLSFRSTSYQWLVVAGARAQYKGEGQIAGDAANYGFLITAIDGALPGGGGSDRFRIKLWNIATGAIVYDNQVGQLEDTDAATVIGGGSIVIHK